MDLLLGKIALITGATRGIGKATASIFARNGAKVLLNGRNEQELKLLADEINELTEFHVRRAEVVAYDVCDDNETKRTFQYIQKQYKRLDVLVNNAGILDDALLGMIQYSQLQQTMETNLFATISHMQWSARLMQRQKTGAIINISSIIGRVGNAGQVVYGASKAGVIGATLSAAKELASYNIRVNAIAPGFIDTDMVKQLPESKYLERLQSIAMQRIGKPEEVANTALYLASDLSSYVTGQVIGVDGGMLI
ncbi:3-oxoacyl-ACP reductase [Desulfuribacillus stibiiarsenatis]|uniref:3-oxoacyl-ACP reductase n=1 Tax=Desulfuribacillus stibiiarsenatis TaxID=1390249 RepID=A0A1E5L9D0_9FIRM|nr:SDR family NAD(P)-dependent oxidoreductase [Desulfuribacillus stibiiarsenatis]OEH86750.1 3-oxoacyl-ACP reductase [Desulfuribacillus stibiiarsenatis]